jgi:hypothetical protein
MSDAYDIGGMDHNRSRPLTSKRKLSNSESNLRDRFAGIALAQLLESSDRAADFQHIADESYLIANAMMRAREE